MIGPQGAVGLEGSKGALGDVGAQGLPGVQGSEGNVRTADAFGHYIVRHSQDSFIPGCPRNYNVLWEGYSLMYTVGNGQAHSQDLGTAGSCSRSFR